MSDLIDNFAPGGGVADVMGWRLSLVMNFADEGAIRATDHTNIGELNPALFLFQLTALSDQFDAMWQGLPGPDGKASVDANGKSQRDLAGDIIRKAITDRFSSASDFNIDLPMKGHLRSFAAEGKIFLSYKLDGCTAAFKIKVALGLPLHFSITFRLETLIIIDLQNWPAVKTQAAAAVEDLHADSNDEFAVPIKLLLDTFSAQISTLLDGTAPPPRPNPQLAQSIAAVLALLTSSAVPAGFMSCVPDVDEDNHVIRLRLNHPIDRAPVLTTIDNQSGGLIPASVGLDRTQARAGDRVKVMGSGFPPDNATRAGVQWNDSTTGQVMRSEVDVSIAGEPAQRVTVPRRPMDNANFHFVDALAPDSNVTFSVRNCDKMTCTPFSQDLVVMTAGSGRVDIILEFGGVGVLLSNDALVDVNGAFAAMVVIPPGTAPGLHRLGATVGIGTAATGLTIVPDTQPVSMQLHQIDPATGQVIGTSIMPNGTVAVRGDGFAPDAEIVVQLDGQVFVPSVETSTSDGAGSFTATFKWPADSTGGTHRIFASQSNSFPQVSTSLEVFVQLSPH